MSNLSKRLQRLQAGHGDGCARGHGKEFISVWYEHHEPPMPWFRCDTCGGDCTALVSFIYPGEQGHDAGPFPGPLFKQRIADEAAEDRLDREDQNDPLPRGFTKVYRDTGGRDGKATVTKRRKRREDLGYDPD
jgi:hypothetical protein